MSGDPAITDNQSSLFLSHAYSQIILFGDSISEQSENQTYGFGFAPALRNAYIRRLDVMNRGFGGYTSEMALRVLPDFFPSASQTKVCLVLVFFGANDATLPENLQHVPLPRYVECLEQIVQHDSVTAHEANVILVTPGPVDEWSLQSVDSHGHAPLSRTAANTKRYADACRELGVKLDVPVVDLWSRFMHAVGWRAGEPLAGSREIERNSKLGELLSDGASFAPSRSSRPDFATYADDLI